MRGCHKGSTGGGNAKMRTNSKAAYRGHNL